jgi:hypothetical protein
MELLPGLVWLSVITNTFLFGFTTEQMATVFPDWFDHVEGNLGGLTGDDTFTLVVVLVVLVVLVVVVVVAAVLVVVAAVLVVVAAVL